MDQAKKPTYGQVFMVFRNPGRFFSTGNGHSDQGVLVIRGETLIFADIRGRSFTVPLNEPNYQLDRKHRLSVRLADGDRWVFMGMFGSTIVRPETESLASQYGINREDMGGVDSYVQSLKRQTQFIEHEAIAGTALAVSARLGGGAASLGADGVGLAASMRAQYEAASNVLEGYAKVDDFVKALRIHDLSVPVAAPSFGTTLVYLGVNRRKNLLFLLLNPFVIFFFGFFLIAFLTAPFHASLHDIGIRGPGGALLFVALLDLLLASISWRLLRDRIRPYKAVAS